MTKLTISQGRFLLTEARRVIECKLGVREKENFSTGDAELLRKAATFVTLKKKGDLRGCIGNLTAVDPLLESVRENAINAAFHDHRFPPLEIDELGDIQISVSVLTEPVQLEYKDVQDLCARLRPMIDGVILKERGRSATFLPQVWEQLPDVSEFLTHLCVKAGLSRDCWQRSAPKISTYQVVYFSEER